MLVPNALLSIYIDLNYRVLISVLGSYYISNPQIDKDNESYLEIEISFDELVDIRFNLLK